jgi:serine/threonine-protein kinase ULK/ATG1
LAANLKVVKDFRINLNQELGRGTFATVYRGFRTTEPNKALAFKVIDREKAVKNFHKDKEMMERYQNNEIQILKKIKHKNIVEFFGMERSSSNFYLAFEYCAGKDL